MNPQPACQWYVPSLAVPGGVGTESQDVDSRIPPSRVNAAHRLLGHLLKIVYHGQGIVVVLVTVFERVWNTLERKPNALW